MEADSTSQSETASRLTVRLLPGLSVALALASGLLLRLWMMKKYFQVDYDSLIYGGIAKHLLQQGSYLVTRPSGEVLPTLIRLPGYPFFLALCFRLFGMENYASAVWVQIALDLAGCLLLADCARRIAPAALSNGAAHATIWMAALCPFTAIYSAQPLTESPTLFAISLGLWSAARFRQRPGWGLALCFTAAVTGAALLRPDGALLALALLPAMVIGQRPVARAVGAMVNSPAFQHGVGAINNLPESRRDGAHAPRITNDAGASSIARLLRNEWDFRLLRMGVVCGLLALAPFAAWTWRNWQVFHVFQPLAPRYANDPDQTTYPGWQRWVKSWSLDFVSTFDIYWAVPGAPLDLTKLPSRAFDSPRQYEVTAALAYDYNVKDHASDIVPEVDARFGQLAEERIHAHPVRFYLWLPLGRLADMSLRPRVENLYDDLDWWAYARHPQKTIVSYAYAGLNVLYLLLAAWGLRLRPSLWISMVAYVMLRSSLLMTIEAPEARYTLECFPMLFVLGSIGLCKGWRRFAKRF
ncbi:MAG: glycosyltransferase family 39 protein [Terracidiphilus sp.]